MAIDIHDELKQLSFPNLFDELPQFQCQVSFWRGRKFTLDGIEGEATFNEIVYAIFDKAKVYSGTLEGNKVYEKLMELHQMGEKELNLQPWWIRWMTLIKRFFTCWMRISYLEQIKDLSDANLRHYCEFEKKEQFLKAFKDQGIAVSAEEICFGTVSEINIVDEVQLPGKKGVLLRITPKTLVKPSSYEGLDIYQSQYIIEDTTQSFEEVIEEWLSVIIEGYTSWFHLRKEMESIATDLNKYIDKQLNLWRSKGERKVDCQYSQVEVNIDYMHSSFVTLDSAANCEEDPYLFQLKFIKKEEEQDLVYHVPIKISLPEDLNDLINDLQECVDSFLSKFLDQIIEDPSAPDPATFEMYMFLFGLNYFDFSMDEDDARSMGQGTFTSREVKKHLQTLETTLNAFGLTDLLDQENYEELKVELKSLKKSAGLRFHPDRLFGKSQEEKDKAAETFKQLFSIFHTLDTWLKSKLDESVVD